MVRPGFSTPVRIMERTITDGSSLILHTRVDYGAYDYGRFAPASPQPAESPRKWLPPVSIVTNADFFRAELTWIDTAFVHG